MTKLGNLRIGINRELYFEYHELPKPVMKDFGGVITGEKVFHGYHYLNAMKEYKASKRGVKVSNITTIYEWFDEINNPNDNKIYGYCFDLPKSDKKGNTAKMIKYNQPCIAEVENNIAIITKIL